MSEVYRRIYKSSTRDRYLVTGQPSLKYLHLFLYPHDLCLNNQTVSSRVDHSSKGVELALMVRQEKTRPCGTIVSATTQISKTSIHIVLIITFLDITVEEHDYISNKIYETDRSAICLLVYMFTVPKPT